MHVEIHSSEGVICSGAVANLTLSSILVKTSMAPRFRETVKVRGADV